MAETATISLAMLAMILSLVAMETIALSQLAGERSQMGVQARILCGTGNDLFRLGAFNSDIGRPTHFYDDRNNSTSGLGEYALVKDFNPAEDIIAFELLAVLQGTSNLSLTANYFNYIVDPPTPGGG
jgi:hypothetical protein